MASKLAPAYQVVADDIRGRIRSGEYAVGDAIPSTNGLMRQYGASSTVVRRAVEQLREAGILAGQQGKAVYIQAVPEKVAARRDELGRLRQEVGDLRAELAAVRDGLSAEIAAVRDDVERLEVKVSPPVRNGQRQGNAETALGVS
jgi:GntR family transcriptional regulator